MNRRNSKIDNSSLSSRDSNLCRSSIGSVEAKLIEQLMDLSTRLRRNDPEFRRLELLPSSLSSSSSSLVRNSTALLLDHEGVNEALQECWRACTGNRHVRSVVLTALPESELRVALQRGVARLEDLHSLMVQETLRSQSLACEDLRAFCTAHMPIPSLQRRGLRSLKLDVRIAVPTQAQLDALAYNALQRLIYLEHVQLHFLPRCSIEEPTLDMHSLVQTLADLVSVNHSNNSTSTNSIHLSSSKLHSIQLTLGYDHNPFRKPMIRNTHVLEKILSSSRLERLLLDNFGFRDEHLWVILRALRTNTTLKHLQLARHHSAAFSLKAVQDLCATLEHHNVTLQSCVLWTNECRRRRQDDDPAITLLRFQQEHLDMWCLLNRWGRGKLIAASKVQTTTHAARARSTTNHHSLWWDMVVRLASSGQRKRRRPPLPRSSLLLGLAVFTADENSQEKPPTCEELASSRTTLGAIYTLVRSHPQMIVDGAVGASATGCATSSTTSKAHLKSKPTTTSNAFAGYVSGSQTSTSAMTVSVEHAHSVRSSRRRLLVTPSRNRDTGKKARRHHQQQL